MDEFRNLVFYFFFLFFSWEQGLTGGSLTKRQRHKDAGTETEERERRTSPYFFSISIPANSTGCVPSVFVVVVFVVTG